jgi:hypothetical protein
MQFVYNKTDFSDGYIPLHMGGETTAYIYHIIKHYDELPSVIVFTQVGLACMCHGAACDGCATLCARHGR